MAYKTLSLEYINDSISFCRPRMNFEQAVTFDSPARLAMTDLTKVSAITAGPLCSIDAANERMIATGVRMLLVTDQRDNIVGLVTATDILGEKPMRHVREVGGSHADVMVRDIMVPKEKLEALSMKEVTHSSVGDVVETLKSVGRQHALVMNEETGRICGIFSTSLISSLTGVEIDLSAKVGDFSELQAALG